MRNKFSNVPKSKLITPVALIGARAQQIAAKMKDGVAAHNQGNYEQAKLIYEEILSIDSKNFDALQLLATLAAQNGQFEKAVELFIKALKINNKNAFVLNNFGNALQEIDLVNDALENYSKAIALNPNYAEAHSNRGNVLQKLKREQDAVASYDRAIALKPNYSEAYFNRGNALRTLKNWEAAVASYESAIALSPAYIEAHFNLGGTLLSLRRFQDSADSYGRCIAFKPDHAEAYCDRGNALLELKRTDEAIASYEQAIAIRPSYADALNNCGVALREAKRFSEAVARYDRAIALRPDYAEAYSNRGVALKDLQQFDEAVASYDRAIAINPKYAEACSNKGNTLLEMAQFEAAVASYDQAISIKPDYAEAYWNKSLILLLQGNYKAGWEHYEWRWANEKIGLNPRVFDQPLWRGEEELEGKVILLHAEQGLGDSIQFCRYAALLRNCGAKVLIEVHQPLVALLKGLDGVSDVVETGFPLPAFDYHCPMLSLPIAFKTDLSNIPNATPYLSSSVEKREYFSSKLGIKKLLRVGLVWSGSAIHTNDSNRSLKLADLIDILPTDCEYISLQKEVRAVDVDVLGNSSIKNFSADIANFTDTAALCDLMDVIISVDTSVAHLAGALGKPTWVLLPHIPDWRWLLDREDSPWYPNMRLFRQGGSKNWTPVLQKLAENLKASKKSYETGI